MSVQLDATPLPAHISNQLSEIDSAESGRLKLAIYFQSLSYNTAKSYLHWLGQWKRWCQANSNRDNGVIKPFPVNDIYFLAFLLEISTRVQRSSLVACVAAINAVSRKGLEQENIKTGSVVLFLKSVKNQAAREEIVTQQAQPFLLTDLQQLIRLHGKTNSVKILRDLSMIWLGFETLLRSAEIRRIRLRHLKVNDDCTGLKLTVFRTKSSSNTLLTYDLSPLLATSILRLLNMVGMSLKGNPDSLLFQATDFHAMRYMPDSWSRRSRGKFIHKLLDDHGITTPLQMNSKVPLADDAGVIAGNSLNRAFESLWRSRYTDNREKEKGLRYQFWTGHSVRVGGAIELAKKGFTITQIMAMGNWTSEQMVSRYIRNYLSQENPMSQLIAEHLSG